MSNITDKEQERKKLEAAISASLPADKGEGIGDDDSQKIDSAHNYAASLNEKREAGLAIARDGMTSIIENCNKHLNSEETMRGDLIKFLKKALFFITSIPLVIVVVLNVLGYIHDPSTILAAIIAIPIEVLGVFGIVSKGLFSNTFRISLPSMVNEFFKAEMSRTIKKSDFQ